jgi:small subunit ribosomal protein S9
MKRTKGDAIHTIGRRKTAVARAFLRSAGSENPAAIIVNTMPYDKYFGRETSKMVVRQPLELLSALEKFHIVINVSGGGSSAQAGATRHAISRALEKFDKTNRPPLKAAGLLTRDPREVERKKYGRHKARRSTQYSKR